jgi:hypothetical protein
MKGNSVAIAFAGTGLLVCLAIQPAISQESMDRPAETRHVLFVGDSFTHGRYLPVRTYNNTPGTGGLPSIWASMKKLRSNSSGLPGKP